jgi:plastocyanin
MTVKPFVATAGAVALLAFPLAAAAQTGAVSGTVTAAGVRTPGDIVISLERPGLTVTPPAKPAEMDQKNMRFVPHVIAVVTGTTVQFLNSDAVAHNVFSPEGKYNLGTWPQGQTRDHTFDKAGVYTQLCRVHPEMEGYILVLDTPYFAVTDKAGAFEITGVPAGTYTLTAWSEKLKSVTQEVSVEAGKPVTVNVTMGR